MDWAGALLGVLNRIVARKVGDLKAKKESEIDYILGTAPLGVEADTGNVIHLLDISGLCGDLRS